MTKFLVTGMDKGKILTVQFAMIFSTLSAASTELLIKTCVNLGSVEELTLQIKDLAEFQITNPA